MARSETSLVTRAVLLGLGCACLTTLAPSAKQPVARTDDRPARRAADDGDRASIADLVPRTDPARGEKRFGGVRRRATAPDRQVDCRIRKCVALTFDDGPGADTARLLDILAAHGARATFFVVGRSVREFPRLVHREAAEGHELANHTDTHADLRRSPPRRIVAELWRTQRAIRRAAGVSPTLMRPPYGATDGRVAAVGRRMRLAQVLWSLDPLDWRDRDAERVERRVVTGVRRNSVVLLHDIHPSTVDAMPGILRRLADREYSFVTVSELYGRPLVPGKMYPEP